MIYNAALIAERTWLILECGFNAIYYLEGDDRGLLIDTGIGAGDLKAFVDTLASKPYDVILTHGHLDHVGAVTQFKSVMIHHSDRSLIHKNLNNEGRQQFIEHLSVMSEGRVPDADVSNMIRFMDVLPELIDIEDGAYLQLGNRPLHVVHTPGHTDGSICIVDEKENIAFVGDTIIYRLLMLGGPKDYTQRLRTWWDTTAFLYDPEVPFKALYTGHVGMVSDKTKNELREIVRLLLEDITRLTYEGTSPRYVLGDTQLYLESPQTLSFTEI